MANIFILAPDGSKTLVTKDQLISFAQRGRITPETQIEVLGRVVAASKVVELKQYFDAKEKEKSEQAPQPNDSDAIPSAGAEAVANEFSEQTNKEDSLSFISPLESEKPQELQTNPDIYGVIPQLAPLLTSAPSQTLKPEKSPKSAEEKSTSSETFDVHGKAFEKLVDTLIDRRIPVIGTFFGILFIILAIAGVFGLIACFDAVRIEVGISALISGVIVFLTLLCIREMIYAHLKNQIRQELFLTEILKELKSKSNHRT